MQRYFFNMSEFGTKIEFAKENSATKSSTKNTRNVWCDDIEFTRLAQYSFSRTIRSHSSELLWEIPKIIHFIWLGSSLPSKYRWNIDQWKIMHEPTWEVRLWTDEDVAGIVSNNRIFNFISNYGCKSDILRYEVIPGLISNITRINLCFLYLHTLFYIE